MERRGGASSTAMEGDNHRAGQRGNRRNPGNPFTTMTKDTQNIPFAAKAVLAAVAVAWILLMGWAAGDAWEHDGLAHSGQAFETENQNQNNQGDY